MQKCHYVSSVMLDTNESLRTELMSARLLSDLTWYGSKSVWWDLSCACDIIEMHVRGCQAL